MDSNEHSGERLFVTITNKGLVRRYVDGVLVLETDDNFSVLANRVDPQGVAALLDRCQQRFSNRRGQCLSPTSPGEMEVENRKDLSTTGRTCPPDASGGCSSKVDPVHLQFLTPSSAKDLPGPGKKVSSKGVTLVTKLMRMYKE